jgi:hypothetical protein
VALKVQNIGILQENLFAKIVKKQRKIKNKMVKVRKRCDEPRCSERFECNGGSPRRYCDRHQELHSKPKLKIKNPNGNNQHTKKKTPKKLTELEKYQRDCDYKTDLKTIQKERMELKSQLKSLDQEYSQIMTKLLGFKPNL